MRPVFYFDLNSPYAYLAAERIDDLIPDAEWRPIAFPLLLREHGRLEEAMARDPAVAVAATADRLAERGLPPLSTAAGWPMSWSLTPLRAALVADEQGRMKEFVRGAFRKVFAEGLSLADDENLRAVVDEAGLDPDAVVAGAERPEIKQRLKENGEEALARGVTGIPTVAVGDELFWGDDRLDEAALAARAHRD
jgi:2-hydroxychromene-2-carboxylate isomerase